MHDGWSWFDLSWPWIGLTAAAALLVVLRADLDPAAGTIGLDRSADV